MQLQRIRLRPYQEEAVDKAVDYMKKTVSGRNGLLVLPTGSGKSLVIANIAYRLNAPVLVLQPNVEILEQNYEKMQMYGVTDIAKYSASAGEKNIGRITFAMIGSIKTESVRFFRFRYVIIDECHLVNPSEGMYADFIRKSMCKVIGLTATPYRLESSRIYGSMLAFLTRTQPRLFTDLVYAVQVKEIADKGYLAKLEYYNIPLVDEKKLKKKGLDYTDDSVRKHYEKVEYDKKLLDIVNRLIAVDRKSILVFTRNTDEAKRLVATLGGDAMIITGNTPKERRKAILDDFKGGLIKVVVNVGVLTTGFDYPALKTVVLARPTRSLSLYYQMVGRAIRPFNDEVGWVVDLCGNVERFGKVVDLRLEEPIPKQYEFRSGGKVLTNVYF